MVFREFFRSLFSSRHPHPAKIPNDELAKTVEYATKDIDLSNLDDTNACQAVLKDINGDDDIIIAVMGATGVGKTTFISAIAGSKVQGIGHDLDAGTSTVNCFKIPIPGTKSHLVLVDTPGFDDPSRSNGEILDVIGQWLKSSYTQDKKLNGLVYLQRITDIRFDSGAATTLTLFRHLCGGDVFDKVCLVTTKWNDVPPGRKREYEEKEKQLEKNHWGVFMAKKSITSRFDSSTEILAKETAMKTLRSIVEHANRKFVVQIQREMVDQGKRVEKTTAGKYAFTFEEKMTAQLLQLNNILVLGTDT